MAGDAPAGGDSASSEAPPDAQVDTLGFPLHGLDDTAVQQRAASDAVARRRAAKPVWAAFAATGALPGGDAALVKRAIRKGVPHHLRPAAWTLVSGAAELRRREEAAGRGYVALQAAGQADANSSSVRQIELDLHRTFPEHPWVRDSPAARDALRRVLLALSASQTDGYCQSHNYLAAWLLLVYGTGKDEEGAFWTLRAVLEQRCAPNTFASDLRGLHIELGTLHRLCQLKLPRVGRQLTALECFPTMYATDWVLCLFCGVLPTDTALRVWDAFLLEGVKVLHRVALALMRRAQAAVMRSDSLLECVDALRGEAKHAHDRDALMELACGGIGPLSGATVQRCRMDAARDVAKQRAETEERRRQYDSAHAQADTSNP